MGILSSKLILSLIDRVTGPAAGIGGALRRLNGQIDRTNRGNMAMLGGMRGFAGQLMVYGGAYLGVTEGIQGTVGAARNMQAQLTEIGIKSDQSAAQLDSLRQRMLKLAPATNQTTTELLGGIDTMVTMGLAVKDAANAMPAIGQAATATKSSITDLSAATVATMQNMGVASSEVAQMLDSMTSAGNAGAFEMRDMATYFPQLTASAKTLGIQGVKGVTDMAAALQIARRGAGDASTAANNMANFLGKIMSPEVSKRFKKFGVDVTKELKKAHKQGISPLEHFIKLVDEKTKGGQADLLGQLFGDKQVLDFVRPMLSDFKDYLRIRDEAERASGTVAEAFARRMQDADERLKALKLRVQNAGTVIGANLLEPIAGVADYFSDIFDTIDSRVTVFDRVQSAFGGFMGGLGFEGSAGGLKALGDTIFGIAGKNGVAAGEELGAIAARFREFGAAVREISDAVRDNPLTGFAASMGAEGFKLAMAAIGLGLFAGAVRKLAAALYLLSGAKAAVGILKALGKGGKWVANAAGLAGGADAIADAANPKSKHPGGANTPTPPITAGKGGWLKTLGLTSVLAAFGSLVQSLGDTPGDTFADQVENNRQSREALQKLVDRITGPYTVPTGEWRAPGYEPARTRGGVSDVRPMPSGPMTGTTKDLGAELRSMTLRTQQTGVADVRLTNPPPAPQVHTNVTVNVMSNASPSAIGAAVGDAVGADVKAALDASYSDGWA